MILENDEQLRDWLYGVLHGRPVRAGGFLSALAQAAAAADGDNYEVLRPALLVFKGKYPAYFDGGQC